MSEYLIDKYVAVSPGDPFRLFPWGVLVKGGRRHEIKPGMGFKLPHFKPPVKLGSHEDATPAGGHIIGLEERADGLYALTEVNERGAQAIHDGAYRYQSPEVIWGESGLEDPATGELIAGPLIVGCALLHTPHLGEAAALYSIEEVKPMSENEQTELTALERFTAAIERLFKKVEDAQPVTIAPDEFAAVQQERDDFKAQIERLEAEKAHQARVDKFAAQLRETKAEPNGELLASLTDDQAAWVVQQFRALSAQIKESNLVGEIGSVGKGADDLPPAAALDAEIKRLMAERKISYEAAFAAAPAELKAAIIKKR